MIRSIADADGDSIATVTRSVVEAGIRTVRERRRKRRERQRR